MSHFVQEHVKRVFDNAGYGVLKVYGDRHGIVQGDGLNVVVAPYIEAAARRFSSDEATVRNIVDQAVLYPPIKLELYGGSVSIDLEGIYLPDEFIEFLKDECRETYYQAQNDVDAIFDAEDAPDAEWDEARQAYIGTVDEFSTEGPDGNRLSVRVRRISDQSFSAYESGEEEYDAKEAADIIEGKTSHGSIEVEVYGAGDRAVGTPENVYVGRALSWTRDDAGANVLDLAAEIVADEGNDVIAAILRARSVELGLPPVDAEASETVAPSM